MRSAPAKSRFTCSTSPIRWCRMKSPPSAQGKNAVLMVEEGQPNYLEQAMRAILQERSITATAVHGKDCLPLAGEYTGEVVLRGLAKFFGTVWPDSDRAGQWKSLATRSNRSRTRPPAACKSRCRRGRRVSASAVRSGRCSAPSRSPNASSARHTSPATSAATSLRRCRRSTSATPCSAMASALPAAPASRRISRAASSTSWATAASGITGSPPAWPARSPMAMTASSSS